MLFAEEYAGLLLVVHTVVAVALVGATTHLVLWMRGFPRGRFERIRAVRKFAVIAAGLYVLSMLIGNVIYPVYKVRVRAEFLDRPTELVREYRQRSEARYQVAERYQANAERLGQPGADPAVLGDGAAISVPRDLPQRAAKVARWFDVKEHWVSLGMALSLACAVILTTWNPKRHGRSIAAIAFLMALGAAVASWLGAIIGLVVASYRSIGGL
ncbi:MAG: hypothetical protein AAGC55_27775 [Myxococcota bacterium]